MIVTYDPETDAAYIYLDVPTPGSAARTLICDEPEAAGAFHLDLDKSGRLIGIEILGAKRALPASLLASAKLPGQTFATPELVK